MIWFYSVLVVSSQNQRKISEKTLVNISIRSEVDVVRVVVDVVVAASSSQQQPAADKNNKKQ